MFLLVRQATIIDPRSAHHQQQRDILIKDGRITQIAEKIETTDAEILEIEDLHVSPGWVDIGLQIGDPGFEHREDIQTATQAAASGGYTAIAPFPNTEPVIHSKAALNYWRNQSHNNLVNILPIAAITHNCTGKDITEMIDMQRAGAIAFSDGANSTQDNGMMMRALQYVRAFDGVIINHPHDYALAGGGHMHEGFTSTSLGIKGISHLAEEMMVVRDINLAEYTDSKVHIHGISTEGSLALIRKAKAKGMKVSCSVPALNLAFEEDVLAKFDPYYKVLPPLREASDRSALIQGLEDGTIDLVISNHVPLEEEKKKLEFAYADFGAVGLESCYSLLNTFTKLGQDKIAALLSLNADRIFNLSLPIVEVDQLANLTLFTPEKQWTYNKNELASKSNNTPLHGQSLKGRVVGIVKERKSQFFRDR